MKTICLYFEIHQIIHLKRYRFFDIGTDHYYYDDYENERSITDIAYRSYMPALDALKEMIDKNGDYFKVAFSLSGTGIEQLEMHAPQVLEKLQELNETGCVEFLAEPYSHGLAALANEASFARDVKKQAVKIKEYFGQEPQVLRNSSRWASNSVFSISPTIMPFCSCWPSATPNCWSSPDDMAITVASSVSKRPMPSSASLSLAQPVKMAMSIAANNHRIGCRLAEQWVTVYAYVMVSGKYCDFCKLNLQIVMLKNFYHTKIFLFFQLCKNAVKFLLAMAFTLFAMMIVYVALSSFTTQTYQCNPAGLQFFEPSFLSFISNSCLYITLSVFFTSKNMIPLIILLNLHL